MSYQVHFRAGSVILSIALYVGSAAANSRYPFASQMMVDPSDANHLVVRSSFGILQSVDSGRTWSFICEGAVGYQNTEDPWMGVTNSGAILAGTPRGLSQSTDRGCNWAFAGGELAKQQVADLVVEQKDPSHAISVTSTAGDGGFHNVLVETTDNAATWHLLGAPLPADMIVDTIEVAPSEARRIYVSGRSSSDGNNKAVLERSDDRGATWSRIVPNWGNPASAWIGSVDPMDPNRVYVRLKDSPERPLGTMFQEAGIDRLGVLLLDPSGDASLDASGSWKDLFTGTSDFPEGVGAPHGLIAFAMSPDGKSIAIGGYDDNLHIIATDTGVDRKVLSTVAGKDGPYAIHPLCLNWTSAGLYACGFYPVDLFTVGFSTDEGATFHNLLEWDNGFCLLECSAGTTTGDKCPAEWAAFVSSIPGFSVDCSDSDAATSIRDAATSAVEAAANSAMSDATAVPPEALDGDDAGAESGLSPPAENPTGCGCRLAKPRAPERGDVIAWVAGIAGMIAVGRRSRRGRPGELCPCPVSPLAAPADRR